MPQNNSTELTANSLKCLDINQILKDTENALRDFISYIMNSKFGDNWYAEAGIKDDKRNKWSARKEEENKLLGNADARLLYYADFHDLSPIIDTIWGKCPELAVAFGEKKKIQFWLKQLEGYRNPNAHNRELMPYQKHLALGIEGEIRIKIIQYHNKHEHKDDYYPRIEHARDSFGNVHNNLNISGYCFNTKYTLRPGYKVEFVVTAREALI